MRDQGLGLIKDKVSRSGFFSDRVFRWFGVLI